MDTEEIVNPGNIIAKHKTQDGVPYSELKVPFAFRRPNYDHGRVFVADGFRLTVRQLTAGGWAVDLSAFVRRDSANSDEHSDITDVFQRTSGLHMRIAEERQAAAADAMRLALLAEQAEKK
jgi:hypothetical protein